MYKQSALKRFAQADLSTSIQLRGKHLGLHELGTIHFYFYSLGLNSKNKCLIYISFHILYVINYSKTIDKIVCNCYNKLWVRSCIGLIYYISFIIALIYSI